MKYVSSLKSQPIDNNRPNQHTYHLATSLSIAIFEPKTNSNFMH